MRLVILIGALVIQSVSYAGEADVCFVNKNSFFDPISKVTMKPGARASTMSKLITELSDKDMHKGKGISETLIGSMTTGVAGILFGHAVSAFSRLDQTELQKSFQKELDRIKQVKNPMDRMKQVYDLVVRTQGEYDEYTLGFATVRKGKVALTYTPGNLINSAEEYGTAGVCREFASLLQWSLLQVARHPDSKGMALGPNDFSSELVGGDVPIGAHAWVRAHLPKFNKDGQLQGFNDFDLDTTWYSEFSPVYPRRSGISEEERKILINESKEIAECLKNRQKSLDREQKFDGSATSHPRVVK